MTTRVSGGKPYFSATLSGRISTRRIASGGKLRSSRKLVTRWPLTSTTGIPPPPRPRPDPVCGLIRVSNSPTEVAPVDWMSASLSVAIGASTVSTWPLIVGAVTTMSLLRRSPLSSLTALSVTTCTVCDGASASLAWSAAGGSAAEATLCAKAGAAHKASGMATILCMKCCNSSVWPHPGTINCLIKLLQWRRG